MTEETNFTFAISMSVLDHLGRNLYRSFMTVIGEAISNSWDADSNNVWIYLDKDRDDLYIKDDGDGMTADDFQKKFLKIGYTKREGGNRSKGGRPYIGRKGIGKLALLTYSESITVISKKLGGKYTGGKIENSGLDNAIKHDLEPDEYKLGSFNLDDFKPYTEAHQKGTIIHFEKPKQEIRNTIPFLKKILALYFKFSLIDEKFKIFVNEDQVTIDDLSDLAQSTEFLWQINNFQDPFANGENLKKLLEPVKQVGANTKIKGFIASVSKPSDLNIFGTGERVGVDFFVNGRVRDRNILIHRPSNRLTDSYLYGQIHYDSMDDDSDRFTTSREGIRVNDEKYEWTLSELVKLLSGIRDNWDDWRYEHHKEGDAESKRISKMKKSSRNLFDAVSEGYEGAEESAMTKKVNKWVEGLSTDAEFNFESYAECFVSENLVRKHIESKQIPLTSKAKTEIREQKDNEKNSKKRGNLSIQLRKNVNDLGYLSMDQLAYQVDKKHAGLEVSSLIRDAKEYKPIRDALMHTSLLTDQAKKRLSTTYANIKGRISEILQEGNESAKVKKK